MARMPRAARNRREAEAILENIISDNGTKDWTAIPLESKNGLTAYLRRKGISKITSGTQVKGVPEAMFYRAVANIDKLYSNAIEPFSFELNPDADNDDLKEMHRLYSPMEYEGRIIPVKISVKEYKEPRPSKKHGKKPDNKLYAIEAVDFDIPGIKKGMAGTFTASFPCAEGPLTCSAKPLQTEKDIGTLNPFLTSNIAHIFAHVNKHLRKKAKKEEAALVKAIERALPKNRLEWLELLAKARC